MDGWMSRLPMKYLVRFDEAWIGLDWGRIGEGLG